MNDPNPNLLLVLILAFTFSISTSALPSSSSSISSNSVLVALLDSSHYTELAELIEKALLLQTLEDAISSDHNLTIFAPQNSALERDLDPEFRRFLLQPANLKSLQALILHHVVPSRLIIHHHPSSPDSPRGAHLSSSSSSNNINHHKTLLSSEDDEIHIDVDDDVTRPDDVVRPDGVIHGIGKISIPRSVQEEFNRRRNLAEIAAVLPTGAPEVDPRTHRLKKPVPVPAGSPPALPIYDALAPGPSIAPAPAPGPGSGKHHFDGHRQIQDFIHTLILYGGYNELADILVNLTSLATEMGRLVSEGYVLTVLAPNDEAMMRLTADQLSEEGAVERMVYYHMVPEYQTEESMYNAVRRFGKVRYETLRVPHVVVAREADGSVKFGEGGASAYLFDPDIYTDGRISVQGIDSVLFPPEEEVAPTTKAEPTAAKKVVKVAGTAAQRRGRLMETACQILGSLGQRSRFATCQQ